MSQFRLSSSLALSISSQRFLFQVIAYEDLSLGVTVQEQYHACDVIVEIIHLFRVLVFT